VSGHPRPSARVVDETNRLAKVDIAGVRRNVNIGLLDDDPSGGIEVGDWVLIHVGFALSKVDEEEAIATVSRWAWARASSAVMSPSALPVPPTSTFEASASETRAGSGASATSQPSAPSIRTTRGFAGSNETRPAASRRIAAGRSTCSVV